MDLDLRQKARSHAPRLTVAPALAKAAVPTWLGRMENEYLSGAVFDALAVQAERAGLAAEDVQRLRAFGDEERMHGVLCGAVVEALGGEARATVTARPPLPEHLDVKAREAVLRNLLSVSCLSETVAVALIAAERIEMPEGPLRDFLTSIWSDEIGHARFGWGIVARFVPTVDAQARARLNRYLAVAFRHFEEHEMGHVPASFVPPIGGTTVGLCEGRDARALVYDTVHDVIIPRLTELGLEAKRAWETRAQVRFDGGTEYVMTA